MSPGSARSRGKRSGREVRLALLAALYQARPLLQAQRLFLAQLLVLAAPLGLLSLNASMGGAAETETSRIDFVGRNLFGRAEGTFSQWRVVDQSLDLANPAASHVVVEVTLASVETGNADRDEHLRTVDFFDVAKHPVATVRGHSARPLEPSAEGHPRHAVRFDVDLHGVKQSIDGEIEIVETDPVVVEGGFLIRRADFGVGAKPSAWNPMSIDDEVPVRFRIAFDQE